MRSHPTASRRSTRGRTLVVSAALAVALVGCGDKATTDAGTDTSSGASVTTTTKVAAPTTTTVALPVTTGASSSVTTTLAPVVSPPSVVTTTSAKPGPSAADVAELERALDDIDKLLTDIQTEMNDN